MPRFLTILAFLSRLPDAAARRAVLRRRLEILSAPPPSFFFADDGSPLRATEEPDPYRRSMAHVAGAARRAEIAWLEEMLAEERRPRPAAPTGSRHPPRDRAYAGRPSETRE